MLPEKTEFLKVTLPLGSTFAMKITTDRVHIERLKAEREADRLKP
jgi:hypothetical protein